MLGDDTTTIADPYMQKFLHKGLSYGHDDEDDEELQNVLKALSKVDMILAYSSKKLVNLENLLWHVLSRENDIESIDFENDIIAAEFVEKAFTFDLLYTILNFELRELDNLLENLQDLIVDALRKISSSEHSTELLTRFDSKLHDSEDLLKQSQDRVLEMTIQLAKLEMTSFVSKHNEYKHHLGMGIKHGLNLSRTELKHESSTEHRRVLRMLELSLANEVELEKMLTRLKQNEEDLKVKIRLIEQVGVCMEEAAEVTWGRFLEADNAAAVLMGISKETMGRLQTLQLEHISSSVREGELKSKLDSCINQLHGKEVLIGKLDGRITELMADNAEVTGLREQVQILEQKLSETSSQLMDANASNEASQRKIRVMEGDIESLRRDVYAAEGRAGEAEEKVAHLTDSNLELTEELEFLKGSNESNAKKVSVLEKQVREFDSQLQHARASSEAGQEQQSMLYTAIWDMETLIDELKQKVASGEIKAESSEERCILLSESNEELKKEVEFLRSKVEFMEASLDEAMLQKQSSVEDINVRTRIITDMVMRLGIERERIQKQLACLTKENKILRGKVQKERRNRSIIAQSFTSCDENEFMSSRPDLADSESANGFTAEATEASNKNFQERVKQVEESAVNGSLEETGTSSSSSENHSLNSTMKAKAEGDRATGTWRRTYTILGMVVLLTSILAAHLLQRKLGFKRVES